jgi:hypothetical protein
MYTTVPGVLHNPVAELTDAICRLAAVELDEKGEAVSGKKEYEI